MPQLQRRERGRWRRFARGLTRGVAGLSILVLAAWFVGRLVSDRYGWSQWLLWIPTPAALVAAVMAGVAGRCWARGDHRRRSTRPARRRWLWPAVTIAMAACFLVVEHRVLVRAGPESAHQGSLKIMHWNMGHWKRRLIPHMAGLVMEFEADISIITDGGGIGGDESLKAWLGPDSPPRSLHPFTILTRLPIVEVRPLIYADDIAVGLLVLDAQESIGRNLAIYMVDLPSGLRRGRWEIAARTHRLMVEAQGAGAPKPDLLIGDLNMTRGGAALDHLAHGLEHAWTQGGHGYGASFPRGFALYHIDHLFLGPGLRCPRYDLVDAGMGRHRAQAAWITAAP
jgi:hypothetical protein